jgi:5-methylcytosine-specific restriction endonuclease McrA
MKPLPRKMARPEAIVGYWRTRLLRWGKEPDPELCFLCQMTCPPLERAHLLSHAKGGHGRPSNLVLLCSYCHKGTEGHPTRVLLRMIKMGQWTEAWMAAFCKREPLRAASAILKTLEVPA